MDLCRGRQAGEAHLPCSWRACTWGIADWRSCRVIASAMRSRPCLLGRARRDIRSRWSVRGDFRLLSVAQEDGIFFHAANPNVALFRLQLQTGATLWQRICRNLR